MDNTVTVADLIEALRKLPQEYLVLTEGCDCLGEVQSISVDHNAHQIMLNRGIADSELARDIALPVSAIQD